MHEISEMVEEEFQTKKKGTRARTARYKYGANAPPESSTQPENKSDVPEEHPSAPQNDADVEETVADEGDLHTSSEIDYKWIEPVVSPSAETKANSETLNAN